MSDQRLADAGRDHRPAHHVGHPGHGRDVVRADEPHPGHDAAGGRPQGRGQAAQAAGAAGDGAQPRAPAGAHLPADRRHAGRCPGRAEAGRLRPAGRYGDRGRGLLRLRRGGAQDVRRSAHRVGRPAPVGLPVGPDPDPAVAGHLPDPHRRGQRRPPRQGPEEGPVHHRGGHPHDGRRGRRGAGDRAGGAPAHPLDLRVRRHGGAGSDGPPARHDRRGGRRLRRRGPGEGHRRRVLPPAGLRRGPGRHPRARLLEGHHPPDPGEQRRGPWHDPGARPAGGLRARAEAGGGTAPGDAAGQVPHGGGRSTSTAARPAS